MASTTLPVLRLRMRSVLTGSPAFTSPFSMTQGPLPEPPAVLNSAPE